MGACATKPKVAKDGDIAPVLRPEAEKKAVSVAEVKSENVVVVKEEITEKDKTIDKVSEIVVDDDKIDGDDDDQSAKRRSLSKLFKENEQAKEVVAESEAAKNPEKQESAEIEKPQNLIIEERSVITLNATEEVVKPSEVVLQEAAAPKVEQLETEIPIEEVEKHEEKPEKQEEIKPAAENAEKQVIIVADDEKFADAPATIVTEKSLEPEEIKQVTAVVTETSLLEPKEKQDEEKAEKQENIVVTDEKVADAQANISTEKSTDEPEEIKQVTIVTEKSSSEPTEEKQESEVSEKPVEITESSTSSSAVVEIAPPPPVIEIKSSQPEKEEKAEEAK